MNCGTSIRSIPVLVRNCIHIIRVVSNEKGSNVWMININRVSVVNILNIYYITFLSASAIVLIVINCHTGLRCISGKGTIDSDSVLSDITSITTVRVVKVHAILRIVAYVICNQVVCDVLAVSIIST
jgi:hypothetical protein